MDHTWKNEPHLNIGSHLEKWVILVKIGPTCINRSTLEKLAWLGILGNTDESGSYF